MRSKQIVRILVLIAGLSLISAQTVQAATKKKATVCAECKSKAEGVDKSAAAKANSWTGTIIGVNFGDQSVIVTDGTALDHIKTFAQRYVKISDNTEVTRDGEPLTFDQLDVGQRIKSYGSYNATTRVVAASRVEVIAKVANPPAPAAKPAPAPTVTAADTTDDASPTFTQNLKSGSKGAQVTALQQVLVKKGYLKMPAGVKYGNFGSATVQALKKYQRAMGITQTGTVGPQTRAKLNRG